MDSTGSQSHNTSQPKRNGTPAFGPQLLRTMLLVALVLFVTEFAVMCILPSLNLEGTGEFLADSILLAVLSLGPLYFLGFQGRASLEQPAGNDHHFHFFRFFLIVSVVAIAAVLLLVGLGAHRVQKDHCIEEAQNVATDIAAALRNHEIGALYVGDVSGDSGLAIAPEAIPQLDRRLRDFLAPFDIVKIKVFDRHTRIIYSTDAKIVGKLNRDNADLQSALAGRTVSKMEYRNSVLDMVAEQRFNVDIIETYVPVLGPDGEVVGAFEIYKDVTSELQAAQRSWRSSFLTLAVVLLAVFAGLSALMHRASKIIQTRGADLERSRDELRVHNTALRDTLERETRLATQLEIEREKAEASNKAKSEFLANMSHEIRTPMTAILGFADNLLENDLPTVERMHAIRTIGRNGTYLLSIINDILDLSKIEANKMAVERVPCDPRQIVAEIASLMRVRSDAKGLEFHTEYVGPIPKTIQNDPVRLRQVLINLIGNAIKFTHSGTVRLVTRLVDGEPKDPLYDGENQDNVCRSLLQFDVIDTGLGITEKRVERLFDPFTQADASTTREYGGTGLGLTISKHFALLLGGDITVVETEKGVGTTVRATVATGPLSGVEMMDNPLASPAIDEETSQVAGEKNQDLSNFRILLAEDGPDSQRLISYVLKKAGAEVVIVENGRLAVNSALEARDRGSPFDIILMDMQMPVMDGYAATRALRAENYEWPIIALTAHTMTGDRQKCLDAGCDDYASKPINRKTLIAMIYNHRRSVGDLVTA